ncbi:ABC transporter ATP-binding protein [Virgibacillus pantothenticus]|uniref:ABC transporter ATP-binding protein n=1 Tax=Virgibacillus pantothenticus TaxID=1473 RepID=UPI0009854837|nr:ABC transporter ATP-binding protein [Virgibacillus pantothenticus]
MSLLEVKNVSKTISNKTILENIDLTLKEGEILGFLGPNGAGKTTTIKLIVGLFRITEGDIIINNYSINENPQKAKSSLGVIVENPAFYPYMSGYENLKHSYRLQNGAPNKNRIKEVLNIVGLTDRIHDKVKKYSLGMKQRLGLAQALLHQPKILILDEPTNGLDPDGIKEMRRTLKKLASEEDIGIIISSHLLSEMELMCDRVTIIRNGKIIANKILDESNNSSIYKLNTTNNIVARKILNKKIIRNISRNELILECSEIEIQRSIRDLVEGEIDIKYVNKEKVSLEDYFVTVTKDGSDISESIDD